ncbi:integrase arm-type DNA-binding domain-containing protein [Novosphingobium sp. P6W]|uniref:tyrosine-type recombinase/integrase n=1 Tax=Novosphingobium sp. P6W TaxID=1609758 RepID=UPI000DEAF9E8|nr:integrase arm-type DNA-binding domain-containing protein [Novosphingobium sp. P6W]AXB79166.1 integrase [Novosphingobium sp. P6W]
MSIFRILCRESSCQGSSSKPAGCQEGDLHLGVFCGVISRPQEEIPPMRLKDLECRHAAPRDKDYKLADGGGLHLLVRPNGSKLWRMKYRFAGKEKLLSFGGYPAVSLSDARLKRAKAKIALSDGLDPGAGNETRKGKTFEQVARAWHANRLFGLDNAHASRLLRRLERDAFPVIGAIDVRKVTSAQVLEMLRSVEARGALDVSRRIKQHVSQIYRFAIPQGWADNDPAQYLTNLLQPKPRVRHMARVGVPELPKLIQAIDQYDGEENPRRRAVTRAALLFTLLTWARTNETRLALWSEFDGLDGADPIWRLPAERMKMGREHIVPLSAPAVALLDEVRKFSTGAHVFVGDKPGQPISQNTMIYGCYRMGYRGRQTVHGFRGIASTWANEAECYPSDWIEMALAHVERDDVRGAYNSALYLTPRRRMLSAWADYVIGMIGDEMSRNGDSVKLSASRCRA